MLPFSLSLHGCSPFRDCSRLVAGNDVPSNLETALVDDNKAADAPSLFLNMNRLVIEELRRGTERERDLPCRRPLAGLTAVDFVVAVVPPRSCCGCDCRDRRFVVVVVAVAVVVVFGAPVVVVVLVVCVTRFRARSAADMRS